MSTAPTTMPESARAPTLALEPPSLTEAAIRRIKAILAGEKPGTMVRVSVLGGGCSGFRYDFALESNAASDDLRLGNADAPVVIDQESLVFLSGAQIDFIDSMAGQSFQINNPQAQSSCGCGVSFTPRIP